MLLSSKHHAFTILVKTVLLSASQDFYRMKDFVSEIYCLWVQIFILQVLVISFETEVFWESFAFSSARVT